MRCGFLQPRRELKSTGLTFAVNLPPAVSCDKDVMEIRPSDWSRREVTETAGQSLR